MSTLSKVASFILLLDQKLHKASAFVYDYTAVKAYKAADATFKKNKAKATLADQIAHKRLQDTLDSIDAQAARARIRALKDRDIAIELAGQQHALAAETRDKYENIGAITASAAATKDAVIKNHAAVRAQL